MSSTIDRTNGIIGEENLSCRMAYMIGNEQPVLCTLVGDQPLFYADEVDFDHEEESIMEETGDLLYDLTQADLKERAQLYQKKQDDFAAGYKNDIFAQFLENAASFNMTASSVAVQDVIDTLYQSRLGDTLLTFAAENDIKIENASEVSGVEYNRVSGTVLVNPALALPVAVVAVTEALRTAWQHRQGILINPLTFQPEDAITINRAHIADLCAVKVRVAWELKMAGNEAAWAEILSSGLADIAYSFDREVKVDFRTLNNGFAMQAAFEKWFLSDRCKLEDKRLIQTMLADHAGLIFEEAEMSHMVTVDVMTRLGDLPFGKNYLNALAASIIGDPLYTEVRDRSSANFLWFIKFESSFRKKERELHVDNLSGTSTVNLSPFTESKEQDHEEERFGEVIAFPFAERQKAKDGKAAGVQKQVRGNVVSLFRCDDEE